MDINDIRHKLTYGVPPLTLDECRWLYAKATGDEIVTKPRCGICHATGRTIRNETCPNCQGTGFLPAIQADASCCDVSK